MDIAKKLALGILSPLFITLLFATAFDVGFVRTATRPDTVKKIISQSGIYNSVVPSVLQQAGSIQTNVGTISANDPAIQKAANAAISPQFVKQNSEAAIDSVYKWLDGTTTQPEFNVDLGNAKTNFADNVASEIQQRLAGLPACSVAESSLIAQSGQFDAIDTTCLPKGVTAASAAAQVKSSLDGGKGFLDQVTLNSSNIKNSDGQPVFQTDKIKKIPKDYQLAKKTPLILSVLTILVGTGIVFLSRTWQKGLRHIGINLAVIGVVMLALAYGLNRAVSTKIVPKITIDNAILQTDVRNLVTDLTQQIDKNYWIFGGLYTVLGAGSITAAEIFKRRNAEPVKAAAAPVDSQDPPPKTKKAS